jgi:hypothetical protein
MKTFEMNVPGAKNALEVIEEYFHIVSVSANKAWFEVEEKMDLTLTSGVELSPVSWLVQFMLNSQVAKTELVPCLVTALINTTSKMPGIFQFVPIHIVRKSLLGFYDVKVYDTECMIERDVKGVVPSFDLYFDEQAIPMTAKVVLKFLINYEVIRDRPSPNVEMPFNVSYIFQDCNGENWWPLQI